MKCLEKRMIEGIPLLSCQKGHGRKKPLVLCSHSLMESKEIFNEYLKSFAELGCYAVALDNKYHGERSDQGFKRELFGYGKLNVLQVRRLIKETADEILMIIDHFVDNEPIDEERIGMVGISIGGYITLRALILDRRIRVAAPMISSPFWDDIPNDIPVDSSPEAIKKLKEYSSQYSPGLFLDKFYPRAILMQVGAKDDHLNVGRVKKFHQNLQAYYKENPSNLGLIIHEDAGHGVTPAMWSHTMAWFEKHL